MTTDKEIQKCARCGAEITGEYLVVGDRTGSAIAICDACKRTVSPDELLEIYGDVVFRELPKETRKALDAMEVSGVQDARALRRLIDEYYERLAERESLSMSDVFLKLRDPFESFIEVYESLEKPSPLEREVAQVLNAIAGFCMDAASFIERERFSRQYMELKLMAMIEAAYNGVNPTEALAMFTKEAKGGEK